MIKVWIVILTTAHPPHVDPMTQMFQVFDEVACRRMEQAPTILKSGLYWSARCESILIPKPERKEK